MSELAELILKDLTETMRKTLAPFIEKIEQTNKQYKTLVTLMNNMPEFQKIIEENMLLKSELQKQKSQETVEAKGLEAKELEAKGPVEANTVTLEITPLADTKIVAFNVNEHVKQIYETVNNEEDASEIEDDAASEVEEEEAAEAAEEEESEAEEEEAEEEEAEEEEAEEEEAEEEEAEEEEEASEAGQEEASEAGQEEASEAEEEEASEAEEEEAEEEEAASEAGQEEAAEEEEASEADQEEASEAEEEVFTVEIDGVDYYTSDDVNGIIYSVDENEEVGEKVGQFVDGEPTFL